MKEQFLHYAWKNRQFDTRELKTNSGETIEIIYPGDYNRDSGPDFLNAKIRIADQLWSGNVEIHLRSSDWNKHRHQHDRAYDNVILHVVYRSGETVSNAAGQDLPELCLGPRLDRAQYDRFMQLFASEDAIPCAGRLHEIEPIRITGMLSRLLAERLERKVNLLGEELKRLKGDWEELFYRHVARQFGMKVNAEPFQWLAHAVPFRLIAKGRDNLLRTEALLFGQAGLLPEKRGDTYTNTLIREYRHQQAMHRFRPLAAHTWKFLRLRPNNFPTIRIAQLAALCHRHEKMFRTCLEAESLHELRAVFDVPVSPYWEKHYRFGRKSRPQAKRMGQQTIDILLINTVIPFRFLYGQMHDDTVMTDKAIRLLEEMEPEENRLLRAWEKYGIESRSAAESQALIELSTHYCARKKCLQCGVGVRLVG